MAINAPNQSPLATDVPRVLRDVTEKGVAEAKETFEKMSAAAEGFELDRVKGAKAALMYEAIDIITGQARVIIEHGRLITEQAQDRVKGKYTFERLSEAEQPLTGPITELLEKISIRVESARHELVQASERSAVKAKETEQYAKNQEVNELDVIDRLLTAAIVDMSEARLSIADTERKIGSRT